MNLTKDECMEIHKRNAGRVCWLDYLATNDMRIMLKNEVESLQLFMSTEYDEAEQAQAALLCAAINSQRAHFTPPSK